MESFCPDTDRAAHAGNSKRSEPNTILISPPDIINYQIDVDFAQKFAPEITKLLADADRDVVRNAAELSHDLSKSEAACFVMTKSPELVKALIGALGAAKEGKEERKMKEAATGTLFNLSGYDQVKPRFTI